MLVAGAEAMDLEGPLEHFAEHGFARLGRVATEETLAALRQRSDELMLGRVAYPGMFFQRDTDTGRYEDLEFGKGYQGPTLNYRKLEKLEKDPLFLAWIENPLFERVARSLIKGDIAIYRSVLFNKAATGGTELPWHQDGGRYWGLTMEPTLQIWTALDDVPEASGCVRVLPGSHKGGLASPLGGLLQEAALSAKDAERGAIPLPAVAGEVILIHNHLWHRSSVNTTGKPRRAVTTCYMSADTQCVRKKRAPRTFVRVFAGRGVTAGEARPRGQ